MNAPDTTAAEMACVGIVMADQRAILDMDLTGDDFRDLRLGALWDLALRMDAKGEPTEPTAILAAAPTLNLPGITGEFVFDCYAARPVTATAAHYARIVANAGALRRLGHAATVIGQLAQGGGDAQEIAERARAEIDAAHKPTATARLVGDGLSETLDALDAPAPAHPTPWRELNSIIGGWRPGALYVIGARPGVGKTILGIQAAIGLCDHGYVALNSLEMPEREIHARIIAQEAEVPLGRLHGRSQHAERLTERDHQRIATAAGRMFDLPLSVDDRSTVTVLDIRSHARTLSRRGTLAGVVVDYLQLMSTPRGDRRPRHEIVADYSRSLKMLAREMDCPVIALSQLNRASEARQDKRPALADLRESGAVEQDADVVILLHTPTEGSDDMDLMVAKNRHGTQERVEMARDGAHARIVSRGQFRARHLTPVT